MKTVINKVSNFTTIHNDILNDVNLSFKAKGILIYMLSKPAEWEYNIRGDISKRSTDKEASVYSGVQELIEHGYVSRIKHRDGTVDYYIFESKEDNNITDYMNTKPTGMPDRENPDQENPDLGNPDRDNRDVLIRKNTTKKEYTKKEDTKIYSEIVEYLNKKTDKNFKASSKKTQSLIKARIKEGFTVEQFKRVIDIKVKAWLNDKLMDQYLRPTTLFSNNFEGYANEKEAKGSEGSKKTDSVGSDKPYISAYERLKQQRG